MAAPLDDRFATALIFPICIAGVQGILAACSTPSSCLIQRRHGSITCSDGRITTPAWILFECFFFAGMTLLNWSAMTDPAYASSRSIGLLGNFLSALCATHGIADPDAYYTVPYGESYFKCFRELLARLGVQVWLELSSFCSVQVSGSLHVTVRMFAGTFADPCASQYLLCKRWLPQFTTEYRDEFRRSIMTGEAWQPQPWDWYHFPVWQSMGQTPAIEYIAERFHDEDRIALDQALTDSLDDS